MKFGFDPLIVRSYKNFKSIAQNKQQNPIYQPKPNVQQKLPFTQQQYKAYKKISRAMQRKNKPAMQDIKKQYPRMVQVNIPKDPSISMKELKVLLNQVYKESQKNKYSPEQVQSKLQSKDAHTMDIYTKLRTYMTSVKCSEIIKRAVADKVAKKVSTQLKIPLKQALCVILMDDFWSTLRQKGQEGIDRLKNYYFDNKDAIHDFVATAVSTAFPEAAPLIHGVKAMFGGPVVSEDPYSIDVDYLRCLFGESSAPAPRKQNHYMYQMTSKVQIPITTLSDGTAIAVISPFNSVSDAFAINSTSLGFVQVASSSTTNPYSNVGFANFPGPFQTQRANSINYGLDYCRLRFINTQAAIQCKGKLISSIFYQPPNASFKKNPVTNIYNTGGIQITDNQLLQNTQYFRRFSNVQCQKLTNLGTWIPQQNSDQCISIMQHTLNGSQFYESKIPFMIIKWTGCNNATTIGSLFIDIGISIQPTAAMRTIYTVTPRGSYQGVFRALKQCRKQGIMLQWLTQHEAAFLFQQHFSQIDFTVQFGEGRYIALPGLIKMKQDQTGQGLCVRHSLQAIGIQNNVAPYSPIGSVFSYTQNVIYLVQDQLVFYEKIEQQQPVLYFNYTQRHCTAVYINSLTQLFDWCSSNHIVVLLHKDGSYLPYPISVQQKRSLNHVTSVTKMKLLRGGVQPNPGPNPSIQQLAKIIQIRVYGAYQKRRHLYFLNPDSISQLLVHSQQKELRAIKIVAVRFAKQFPEYEKILSRIVRAVLQEQNQRIYVSHCLQHNTSVAKIRDVDDIKEQLLKGGVQPNPGPSGRRRISKMDKTKMQVMKLLRHYQQFAGQYYKDKRTGIDPKNIEVEQLITRSYITLMRKQLQLCRDLNDLYKLLRIMTDDSFVDQLDNIRDVLVACQPHQQQQKLSQIQQELRRR